jgi:adenylate cyclase
MTPPQYTFVFGDLVGWTALTFEHGDDHGAELAVGFRRRVALLLPAHGALEVKALGDGIMLRCDDPGQAVRLGLRLTACADAPVRVGMQTGPAVECDGDWYGTTVNVAARLCDAAHSGEVLIGEATVRAAGRLQDVAFGSPCLHRLRNLPAPVVACLVEAAPVAHVAPGRERIGAYGRRLRRCLPAATS